MNVCICIHIYVYVDIYVCVVRLKCFVYLLLSLKKNVVLMYIYYVDFRLEKNDFAPVHNFLPSPSFILERTERRVGNTVGRHLCGTFDDFILL